MVDTAPAPDQVLPQLQQRLEGRVMVAHNAPFDRRVLRQAFERVGLEWPNPPVICTAALARTMLPLQRERRLGALADALGIDVALAHRALADAETCARVLCALFPKLCANAATIAEAVALLKPKRPKTPRRSRTLLQETQAKLPQLEFKELPKDPGVYLFRDSRRPDAVRRQVDLDSQPGAGAFRALDTARGLDRARGDGRLSRDEVGARCAGAGEPPDQGAAATGQHPPQKTG